MIDERSMNLQTLAMKNSPSKVQVKTYFEAKKEIHFKKMQQKGIKILADWCELVSLSQYMELLRTLNDRATVRKLANSLNISLKHSTINQIRSSLYGIKHGNRTDRLSHIIQTVIDRRRRLFFTHIKSQHHNGHSKDYHIMALKLSAMHDRYAASHCMRVLRRHAVQMMRQESPAYAVMCALRKLKKHARMRVAVKVMVVRPQMLEGFEKIKLIAQRSRVMEGVGLLDTVVVMVSRRVALMAVLGCPAPSHTRFSADDGDEKKPGNSSSSNSTFVSDRFLQGRSINYQY